ncbi:MAG TPA: non-canonical purine NTP pyrophosphatase [Patescibacteria group bacterium]|nr:non-canonical purine NTP pyrophosphatase [Patescibacteria group bacterium]
MQRVAVDSSDLVAIGYDAKTRTLEIEFKEGRVYQYLDVASDIHDRFMRVDSFGQYFDAFISGHYRYKRVDQPPTPDAAKLPLAFVTGNPAKLRNLQNACQTFAIAVEQMELPVDEIQSHDGQEIVIKKVKEAFRLAGGERPVLVNDSSWNILALRGFPGAYARYVDEWLSAQDVLKLMEGKRDRTIILSDYLAYYDGQRSKVFSRDYPGVITEEPRGKGRTLEQIIVMAGHTQTVAEREAQDLSSITSDDDLWHEFAKWLHLQRRLGRA